VTKDQTAFSKMYGWLTTTARPDDNWRTNRILSFGGEYYMSKGIMIIGPSGSGKTSLGKIQV
jgi:ABC-type protease/lipase transport system fused ATPase/permease subunit